MSNPIQEAPTQNEQPPRKNGWMRSIFITFLFLASSTVAAYEVTDTSEQPFLPYALQVLQGLVATLDEIPDEPLSEEDIQELEGFSNALEDLYTKDFVVSTVPAVALTGSGSVRQEEYKKNSLQRVVFAETKSRFGELYTDMQLQEVARYLTAIALANGPISQYEVSSEGELGFFRLPQAELPWALATCMSDKPDATLADFLEDIGAQSCAALLRYMRTYEQNPTDAPLANIARCLGGEPAGKWFSSWLSTLSSEERALAHQILSSQSQQDGEHLLPNQLKYQEEKNNYAAVQGSQQADRMARSVFDIVAYLGE